MTSGNLTRKTMNLVVSLCTQFVFPPKLFIVCTGVLLWHFGNLPTRLQILPPEIDPDEIERRALRAERHRIWRIQKSLSETPEERQRRSAAEV